MIKILNIDHVVFRVKDIGRIGRFYEEVLGAQFEQFQPHVPLYQLRLGTSLVDLVQANDLAVAPNLDRVCFRVSPWDEAAIITHLAQFGIVAEVSSRYGADGEGPSIYLHDPEGNQLELKGPATSPPLLVSEPN